MVFKLTVQFLAQEVHFFLGLLVPVFFAYFFGLSIYVGMAIILGIAAIKETLVDPYLEHDPFWTGGAVDFFFYVVGVFVLSLFIIFI